MKQIKNIFKYLFMIGRYYLKAAIKTANDFKQAMQEGENNAK